MKHEGACVQPQSYQNRACAGRSNGGHGEGDRILIFGITKGILKVTRRARTEAACPGLSKYHTLCYWEHPNFGEEQVCFAKHSP